MAYNADSPRPNVYLVNSPEEWPERGDPFVLYNQTYGTLYVDTGLYFYDPVTGDYEQLLYGNEQTNQILLRIARLNGVTLNVKWNDSGVTNVDPGIGYMAGNSINLSTITEFAASNIDMFGRVYAGTGGIPLVGVGDPWVVSDLENLSWYWYTVSAPLVIETGYFRIPVAPQDGKSVNPQNNVIMEVHWLPQLGP